MADKLLGIAVKGVASGIGLVSEGIHHHKERKRARSATRKADVENAVDPSEIKENAQTFEEGDEEHWELDEAQDELLGVKTNEPTSSTETKEKGSRRDQLIPKKITDDFMLRHPPPSAPPIPHPEGAEDETEPLAKLPLPVILPQRRPQDRARGFIRAYAPDLAMKGIDQDTFLDFIETFNNASLAAPWLDALNLAGFATLALPPGISQAVQIAITVSVNIAKDIQSRKR